MDRGAQVLNGMAPAQRHGDVSGAKDMTVSSYTLARSLGDLPSQIDALQALDLVLIRCALFGLAVVVLLFSFCARQSTMPLHVRIMRLCCRPRLLVAQANIVVSSGTSVAS